MTGEEKESAAAEVFVAVDEGVLVKQGQTVLVSTINAVTGKELGRLEEAVMRDFRQRSEHERKALQAINRIEAGFVRRFLDIRRME